MKIKKGKGGGGEEGGELTSEVKSGNWEGNFELEK